MPRRPRAARRAADSSHTASHASRMSTRSNGPLHTLCADLSLPMDELVTMLRAGQSPFNADDPAFAHLTAWGQQ